MNFLELLQDLSAILKKHQNTIDAVETLVSATVPGAAPVIAAVDAVQSAASTASTAEADSASTIAEVVNTVASAAAAPLAGVAGASTVLEAAKAIGSIAQAVADDSEGKTPDTPK
jgi:hypothetical protein